LKRSALLQQNRQGSLP